MSRSAIGAKRIASFQREFLNFLAAVSLRRADLTRQPQLGRDGLYHVNLKFSVGGVTLEEPNHHGFYSGGKHRFLSLQWEDEPLDTAIAEAQKLCPNVSDKLIRQTLRQLMVKIFEDQKVNKSSDGRQHEEDGAEQKSGEIESILEVLDVSQIDGQLIEIMERLCSQAIPQTVYVPIEGVELRSSITFGEVRFHHYNEESELGQLIATIERRDQSNSASARAAVANAQCYAKVTIVGDDIFARAEAVRKVQEAIHVINFGLSSTLHQPSWTKVRIANIIINTNTPTDDPNDMRFGSHWAYPSNRPFSLSKHSVQEELKPVYKDVLSADPAYIPNRWQDEESLEQSVDRLLASYQTNGEIAKRIQRAITWYGKAVDADTYDEQFVNLAIALESLLIGGEGSGPYTTSGSISQNLGERTAFLLKNDFESRYKQLRRTKNLYGFRSAIVHRGESITVEQLKEMDDLVKQVTMAFLHHNFQNWSHFQEWVARQKFTQKIVPTEASKEVNNT